MIPARMRRRDLLTAAVFAAAACSQSADEPSPEAETAAGLDTEPLEQASALIEEQVGAGKLVAATLAVRRGDHGFRRAFGKARSEDAVFLIASISKPMTAAGVMVLADRGALTLSDPANKFLPELTGDGRENITVEHLLTHTSGLPDQLPNNSELRAAHAPLSEFVAGAVQQPLKFEPGTDYSYQSMGILLAAEIVQRITGQEFRDFLKAEVFQPLGMGRTVMGLAPISLEEAMPSQVEFAAPEGGAGDPSTKDWDWNSPYWRDLGAPWGGAHSTAPDIERFLRYFLDPDDRVLKPATALLMRENHTQGMNADRGLGFQLGTGFSAGCSPQTFGHGGSTGTQAWCDPATGLSCVILTTLPARVSRDLIHKPVSDLAASAAV